MFDRSKLLVCWLDCSFWHDVAFLLLNQAFKFINSIIEHCCLNFSAISINQIKWKQFSSSIILFERFHWIFLCDSRSDNPIRIHRVQSSDRGEVLSNRVWLHHWRNLLSLNNWLWNRLRFYDLFLILILFWLWQMLRLRWNYCHCRHLVWNFLFRGFLHLFIFIQKCFIDLHVFFIWIGD